MTLCRYLLTTIEEVSAAWSPTWVHMIVDKRRSSGAVKWSPAHAEAIETGNGGRCGVMASKLSNLRILYFPQSFTHPPVPAVTRARTHTHMYAHMIAHTVQTHYASRSFIPQGWKCDINQSVPTTPITLTVTAAPPPILSAPSPT